MTNEAQPTALDRIDRALARITDAADRKAAATAALQLRHAALRARIGEALDALDVLIEEEDG
jgi:hypothetical protein